MATRGKEDLMAAEAEARMMDDESRALESMLRLGDLSIVVPVPIPNTAGEFSLQVAGIEVGRLMPERANTGHNEVQFVGIGLLSGRKYNGSWAQVQWHTWTMLQSVLRVEARKL